MPCVRKLRQVAVGPQLLNGLHLEFGIKLARQQQRFKGLSPTQHTCDLNSPMNSHFEPKVWAEQVPARPSARGPKKLNFRTFAGPNTGYCYELQSSLLKLCTSSKTGAQIS